MTRRKKPFPETMKHENRLKKRSSKIFDDYQNRPTLPLHCGRVAVRLSWSIFSPRVDKYQIQRQKGRDKAI